VNEADIPEFEDRELTDLAKSFINNGRVKAFEEMQAMYQMWVNKENIDSIERKILEFSDWLINKGWEIEAAWLLGRLLILMMSNGNIQGAKLIAPKVEEFKSFSPTAQLALALFEIRKERPETLFSPSGIERRTIFGFSVAKEPVPVSFFESVDDVKIWIKKTFPPGIYDISLLEEKSNIQQHLQVQTTNTKNYMIMEHQYSGFVK